MFKLIVRDHLALTLSLVAAVTIVAKIWAVAHGSAPSVAGILSSGSVLTSVLGALMSGLPTAGLVPMILAAVVLGEAVREEDSTKGPALATVVAVAFGFIFAPADWFWATLVLLVFMLIVNVLLRVMRRWGSTRSAWVKRLVGKSDIPRRDSFLFVLAFFAVATWGVIATSDNPWLNAEDVTTGAGEVVTGYVLAEDSQGVELLLHRERTIVRVENRDIGSRVVCAVSSWRSQRSVLSAWVWPDPPIYPPCASP